MDNFIVSARKYRPSTFLSVVGQQALVTTLKNAIQNNHLAHAYLFCGPRGVGKTTCARIFAKTINCQQLTAEGEACNECESCVSFNEQRSYNIHELDAASNNSVEDIRSLIDQVRIPPQIGKYSVYIIDEVHMLSQAAFNAFLKTLEEPPAHAIFILATTEKHKIIPTILSRCQIYDFNRISVADTVAHLQYVASKENITAEPEALSVIAQKSDGGMRDALSIFDQVVSFCGANISYKDVIENLNVLDYDYYFKIVNAFLEGNVPQAMIIFNEILNKGFDASHFVGGLSAHLRDVMVCKDPDTIKLLEVGASIGEAYQKQAASCDVDFLYQALKIANDCDLDYRQSKNKRLLVEIMLIRLCQLSAKKKNELGDDEAPVVLEKIFSPAESTASASVPPPVNGGTTPTAAAPPVATQQASSQKPTAAAPKIQLPRSISINKTVKADEVAEASVTPLVTRKKPFTELQLRGLWKDFTKSIPEQVHLATTMQTNIPLLKADNLFVVTVNNSFQEKEINEFRGQLMSFLADGLENDLIEMQIVVDETQEINKVMLPKDIFNELAENNENFKKFVSEFGLEIL
ncbi:MAG: DNA polymerase III subunit gamma/tau [Paludibacteraceae bacterium]|nr:DNA polymerase III subunit gamma/tau [Paludibacteraceae bacterium]